MSLLNLRMAYLRVLTFPREGGMVPKMELLVMSKLLSWRALPMLAGIVPVSWLLYVVRTCWNRECSVQKFSPDPPSCASPRAPSHP